MDACKEIPIQLADFVRMKYCLRHISYNIDKFNWVRKVLAKEIPFTDDRRFEINSIYEKCRKTRRVC